MSRALTRQVDLASLQDDDAVQAQHVHYTIGALGAALKVLPTEFCCGGLSQAESRARTASLRQLSLSPAPPFPLPGLGYSNDKAMPIAGTYEPCKSALLAPIKAWRQAYEGPTASLLEAAAGHAAGALAAAAKAALLDLPGDFISPAAVYCVGGLPEKAAVAVGVQRVAPLIEFAAATPADDSVAGAGAGATTASPTVAPSTPLGLILERGSAERRSHALVVVNALSSRADKGPIGVHTFTLGPRGANIPLPNRIVDASAIVQPPQRALGDVDAIVCSLRHIAAYTLDLVERVEAHTALYTPDLVGTGCNEDGGVHPAAYLPTRAELFIIAMEALRELRLTPRDLAAIEELSAMAAAAAAPGFGGRVFRAAPAATVAGIVPGRTTVESALTDTALPRVERQRAVSRDVFFALTPREDQLISWYRSVRSNVDEVFQAFRASSKCAPSPLKFEGAAAAINLKALVGEKALDAAKCIAEIAFNWFDESCKKAPADSAEGSVVSQCLISSDLFAKSCKKATADSSAGLGTSRGLARDATRRPRAPTAMHPKGSQIHATAAPAATAPVVDTCPPGAESVCLRTLAINVRKTLSSVLCYQGLLTDGGALAARCKPAQSVPAGLSGPLAAAAKAVLDAALLPFSEAELAAAYDDAIASSVTRNHGHVYYVMPGPGPSDTSVTDAAAALPPELAKALFVDEMPVNPHEIVGSRLAFDFLAYRGIRSVTTEGLDPLVKACGHSRGTFVPFLRASLDTRVLLLEAAERESRAAAPRLALPPALVAAASIDAAQAASSDVTA